ncbi:MAG: hypothetical protein KGM87_12945, partial [Betaproteobacteria bacterium]|nr:hypothetical protein [Betaproteobacteria bacterium]
MVHRRLQARFFKQMRPIRICLQCTPSRPWREAAPAPGLPARFDTRGGWAYVCFPRIRSQLSNQTPNPDLTAMAKTFASAADLVEKRVTFEQLSEHAWAYT